MMTDQEIFELAEKHGDWDDFGRWTFRNDDQLLKFVEAIAGAKKQEPVAQCTYPKCQATNGCTGACSKTAPTALAEITKEPVAFVSGLYNAPVHASDISQERVDETAKDKHEDWYGQHQWQCGYERGWDAAMEHKEKQEPVAWFIQYEYRHEFLWREPTAYEKNSALEIKPLYTAPVHAIGG
jgi:hypothetical protein